MSSLVCFGIIECGFVGSVHVKAIKNTKGGKFVACWCGKSGRICSKTSKVMQRRE